MSDYTLQEIKDKLDKAKFSPDEREKNIDSLEIKLGSDNRGIDKGLNSLIKDLNENNKLETIACCSGFISDHYDIRKLKEDNITLETIVDAQYNSDISIIPNPWIRLEPKYHSYNDGEYIVDEKYYELEKTVREAHIGIDEYNNTAKWQLYSTDSCMHFLYHIGLTNQHFWFNKNATFEEYDSLLKASIKRLHINLNYFMENEKQPPNLEYNNL